MPRFYLTALFFFMVYNLHSQIVDFSAVQESRNQGLYGQVIEQTGEILRSADLTDLDQAIALHNRAIASYNLGMSVDVNTANGPDQQTIFLLRATEALLKARDLVSGSDLEVVNGDLSVLWEHFYTGASAGVNYAWNEGSIDALGGDVEMVFAYLNAALEIQEYYKIYEQLGMLYELSGEMDKAYVQYRKAFDLFPGDPSLSNEFSIALLGIKVADIEAYYLNTDREKGDHIGDVPKALATIQHTQDKLMNQYMNGLMSGNSQDGGQTEIREWGRYSEMLTEWKLALWSVARDQGFPSKEEMAQHLRGRDSNDYFFNVAYADLLVLENEAPLSIPFYNKAIEINPNMKYAFFQAVNAYQTILISSNHTAEAEKRIYADILKAFEGIFRLEPENAELVNKMISAAAMAGDDQKARYYSGIYDELTE
jgi:tetratricopeptide (TPR) repeat protein